MLGDVAPAKDIINTHKNTQNTHHTLPVTNTFATPTTTFLIYDEHEPKIKTNFCIDYEWCDPLTGSKRKNDLKFLL